MPLRTVTATRYVTPLREGGSLPAIVEADDDGLYVLKFRGAGQGPKVLAAEVICGEIARLLGLPMPELVYVELDPMLANAEPDEEIQDLLRRSAGLNLALDYLPGSLAFSAAAPLPLDPVLAARIVWFDAYITNVDRTARNPNLLVWHRRLWLIDHGAALYIQHHWANYERNAAGRFPMVKDHILLPQTTAADIAQAAADLVPLLADEALDRIVDAVSNEWLAGQEPFATPAEHKDAYRRWLRLRRDGAAAFTEEAVHARTDLA